MLKSFLNIFELNLSNINNTVNNENKHCMELAAAALMFEIGRADDSISRDELQVMEKAIKSEFNLTENETSLLMKQAEEDVENAVSLFEFTRVINNHLGQLERIRILEILWQVAYADEVIHKYEEHFLRKISDLLYISHKDFIKAKHKAKDKVISSNT